MSDKSKNVAIADFFFYLGFTLWMFYQVINTFVVKVPDLLACPWIIISFTLMIIGVFRTGKRLKEFSKK